MRGGNAPRSRSRPARGGSCGEAGNSRRHARCSRGRARKAGGHFPVLERIRSHEPFNRHPHRLRRRPLSRPLGVACDKSGADAQAEANQAQAKANDDIAKANNTVTTTAGQAQAAADTKIAAAQADFAKTREDYRHKVQANLNLALDKELLDLDQKAKHPAGAKTPDLRSTLPALRAQRDAFVADYGTLANVDPVTWDATKARLDKEWTDLKAAVDKAN